MGNSSIEWTDCTWDPVRGCSMAKGSETGGCVELIEKALALPLKWRKPRKVFVNSMSDIFHESLTDEQIDRVFAVMALCQQHTFQVLAKRPERMNEYLKGSDLEDRLTELWAEDDSDKNTWSLMLPLTNVWLGVSCENQATADARIPLLLQTPAAVRFVSYEPALGPVDFRNWADEGLECDCGWSGIENEELLVEHEESGLRGPDSWYKCPSCGGECAHLPLDERLDWVIVGGESGPGARPFDVTWARHTVEQCKLAGVACFVKQLGAKPVTRVKGCTSGGTLWGLKDRKGGDMAEWPEDLRVRQFPAALEAQCQK